MFIQLSYGGFRRGQSPNERGGVAWSRVRGVRRPAALGRRHFFYRQQPKKAEQHRVESKEAEVRAPEPV